MSELAEAVAQAVTDEWRSTRQIADGIPDGRGVTHASHVMAVRKHLNRMKRHGEAVERTEVMDGKVRAFWRTANDLEGGDRDGDREGVREAQAHGRDAREERRDHREAGPHRGDAEGHHGGHGGGG